MSFSAKTKQELTKVRSTKSCCRRGELGAFLFSCGTLELLGRGRLLVSLATEHEQVAARIAGLLKSAYGALPVMKKWERSQPKKQMTFLLELAPEAPEGRLLFDIGLLEGTAQDYRLAERTDYSLLAKKDCCREGILRGAFLGSGILSDPNKRYQLEFVLNNQGFAAFLLELLHHWAPGARLVQRKGRQVIYIKNIERILDVLVAAGAHGVALEIENIRVIKDVRNQINRQGNCDNANIDKTVRAVEKQTESIKIIQEHLGLEKLSAPLREACEYRLEYPTHSLLQLAELIEGVSRSGLNNRFRKINEIADEIRQQKGV